jgi:hypothetical protein
MCEDNSRQSQLIILVCCMVILLHVSAHMLEAIRRLIKHRKKKCYVNCIVLLYTIRIYSLGISFTDNESQAVESSAVCTRS